MSFRLSILTAAVFVAAAGGLPAQDTTHTATPGDSAAWRLLRPGVEVADVVGHASAVWLRFAPHHRELVPRGDSTREISVVSGTVSLSMIDQTGPAVRLTLPPGSAMFLPATLRYVIGSESGAVVEMTATGASPRESARMPGVMVAAAALPARPVVPPPRASALPKPPPPATVWKRSVGFSYSTTRGNSNVSDGTLTLQLRRTGKRNGFQSQVIMRRGSKDGTNTSRRFFATARLDQKLPAQAITPASASWPSLLEEVSYEVDHVQKLDGRTIVNVGLSFPLETAADNQLAVEGGGGGTQEQFEARSLTTHKTGFVRLTGRQTLPGAAKLTEQVAGLPDFDSAGRYRTTADFTCEAPVAHGVSLRLVVNTRNDNKPPPTLKHFEFTATSGIGFDF